MQRISDRPKYQPVADSVAEAWWWGGLACAVAGLVMVAWGWKVLPEEVPVHYRLDGTPDRMGGKGHLIVQALLGLGMWYGLQALARVPHVFNYPVDVTVENADAFYRSGRRLVLSVGATSSALFAAMVFSAVQRAQGLPDFGVIFWAIGAMVAVIVGGLVQAQGLAKR